jgi:broad specificity phosphatase PhoE
MSLDERRKFIPPNGESWEHLEQRLLDAVNEILGQGEVAAVVTHAGALRALMPPLKGDAIETSLGYEFDNASVTIFDQKADELIQTLENDTSHLRGKL